MIERLPRESARDHSHAPNVRRAQSRPAPKSLRAQPVVPFSCSGPVAAACAGPVARAGRPSGIEVDQPERHGRRSCSCPTVASDRRRTAILAAEVVLVDGIVVDAEREPGLRRALRGVTTTAAHIRSGPVAPDPVGARRHGSLLPGRAVPVMRVRRIRRFDPDELMAMLMTIRPEEWPSATA